MHPELRRARNLYHEWRLLPDVERGRLAPHAREVKELALDLRGHVNSAAAEEELALANQSFAAVLYAAIPRAA
jgi:hypothetical protein